MESRWVGSEVMALGVSLARKCNYGTMLTTYVEHCPT